MVKNFYKIYLQALWKRSNFASIFLYLILFIPIIALSVYLNPFGVFASTVTWTGGGSTNNWSEAANWSTGNVPDGNDSIIFNSTSTKNATVDTDFTNTIGSLTIESGYSGKITQLKDLSITNSYNQSDGTFVGGASNLSIGDFRLESGEFVSTSNVLTISNTISYTGGTFSPNNGTVVMLANNSYSLTVAGLSFYNLVINRTAAGSSTVITINDSFNINGNLTVRNDTGVLYTIQGFDSPTVSIAGDLSFPLSGPIGFGQLSAGINVNLTGDITNSNPNVTFAANLNLVGASSTSITGSTVFLGNLSSTSAGKLLIFQAGSTQQINGDLSIIGVAGSRIILRSSETGVQWNLLPNSNYSLSYVDLQDVKNTRGDSITSSYSLDSGNNANITFPTPSITTYPVNSVMTNRVTASGSITTNGADIIERGFYYGLANTPTWVVSETGNFSNGSYNLLILDLDSGTDYYIQAFAKTATNTFAGGWVDFTTSSELVTNTFLINSSAGPNGSISPSGSISIVRGESKTFTIRANEGYFISQVLVDGNALAQNDLGNSFSYTFPNIINNHTLYAYFTVKTYKIIASSDDNSYITPSGTILIANGADETFVMTAKDGYRINSVQVDGSSVGAVSSYTFKKIRENHSIQVHSEKGSRSNTIIAEQSNQNGNISQIVIEGSKVGLNSLSNDIEESLGQFGVKHDQSTVALSTGAIFTTGLSLPLAYLSNLFSYYSLLEFVHSFWYSVLVFLGLVKHRSRKWGTVIEAGTNIPLPEVKVNLVEVDENNQSKGKIVSTTYTDRNGKYGFVAPPGKYLIEAVKDNYSIKEGGGTVIEIKGYQKGLISSPIVMEVGEGMLKSRLKFLRRTQLIDRFSSFFSVLLLTLGTAIALNQLVFNFNWKNVLLVLFYVAFWLYNLKRLIRKSPWGSVIDQVSQKPISLVLIRIMDDKGKKLIKTVVSNEMGRFSTLLPKGSYKIFASKEGYRLEKPIDFTISEVMSVFDQQIELKPVQKSIG